MSAIAHEELGKKLSARFTVRRFDSALLAVARIVSDEPDAIVMALDDPSFAGVPALVALKNDPATSWVALAVSAPPALVAAAKDAGADVAVPHEEVSRLASELGRALAAN
jgi:DNA-binding NarL/FixJ family response regulator